MAKLMGVFVVVTFAFAMYSCKRIRIHMYRQKPASPGSDDLLVVYLVKNMEDIYVECEYFTGKDQVSNALKQSETSHVQTVSKEIMKSLLADCKIRDPPGATKGREDLRETAQSNADASKEDLEMTRGFFSTKLTILPGTKWCGPGNKAKSYDDLGSNKETDSCCRAHDLCNGTIAPGKTKHNLTNNSKYTSLSCECDDEFYDCLKQVNSYVSNGLGNLYFDILGRECYKEDYPRVCAKHRAVLNYCVEYMQITTEPKRYQWFPAKDYK